MIYLSESVSSRAPA